MIPVTEPPHILRAGVSLAVFRLVRLTDQMLLRFRHVGCDEHAGLASLTR